MQLFIVDCTEIKRKKNIKFNLSFKIHTAILIKVVVVLAFINVYVVLDYYVL
jgi:hypothetical protein